MKKTILIASFIFPERTDWFLSHLETKFNVTKDKVFCYKNLDDNSKLIFTFKIETTEGVRLNLKDSFPNAVTIHKKSKTFYTINALNKLIDNILGDSAGNIDHKTVKINWSEYENKLIMLNGKELSIFNLERVF
jgi:hypothetical protein